MQAYETESHVEGLARGETSLLEKVDGVGLQHRSAHLLDGPSTDSDLGATQIGASKAFHVADARGESPLKGVGLGEERYGLLRSGNVKARLGALQSSNGCLCLGFASMSNDCGGAISEPTQ